MHETYMIGCRDTSPPRLHVALLVPLRRQPEFPRLLHLDRLVRRLAAFLPPRLPHSGAAADYTVVVTEEEDVATHRFNRGALLNLAFHLCPRPVDMVIFHDVDLLPSDHLASHYAVPLPRGVARHLGARWARYAAANPRYLGGVVAMHPDDVKQIDGFPHTFWGWGGEDDAMRLRLEAACIRVEVPPMGEYLDMEEVDLATKLQLLRTAGAKCPDKWEQLQREKKHRPCPGLRRTRSAHRVLRTRKRRVAGHVAVHHHHVEWVDAGGAARRGAPRRAAPPLTPQRKICPRSVKHTHARAP